MKNLKELTPEEMMAVRDNIYMKELELICKSGVDFYPEVEEEINTAVAEAEEMQTSWFLSEYLQDNPKIVDAIYATVENTLTMENLFFKERCDIVINCY